MFSLMIIRSINDADWPAILSIQSTVYPGITPETEAVLRSKVTLGSETCLAVSDRQNNVVGYCLAHPWRRKPACLHTIYETPSEPQLLYIHDIAIAPGYAGKRCGRMILQHLQLWAKQHSFNELSLVSLSQAITYWQGQGFQPVEYTIDAAQYGEGASYMLKQI